MRLRRNKVANCVRKYTPAHRGGYGNIRSKIIDDGMYYLLLDEVQMMDCFEAVLNGYLRKSNMDVFVTGSNAKFLSSDIITEFAGCGDEVHMLPLRFSDLGSRNARINFRQFEPTHAMENVIYNELCMRGYRVDVGVVPVIEKDKNGNLVRKQEIRPFLL